MGEHSKINPGPFIEFLSNTCPAILGATKDEFSRFFANLEMMNKVRHFIGDEQDCTLFVSREVIEQEKEESPKKDGGDQAAEREYNIVVGTEVSFKGKNAAAVAFLKRNPQTFKAAYEGTLETKESEGAKAGASVAPVTDPNRRFVPHLQIVTAGSMDVDVSPFELVNVFLQNGFMPLFNAYKQEGQDEGDDAKIGIPNVQRKIADLSMALMQCQQHVEIEEIHLPIDHEILEAFEKGKAEGKTVTAEDLEERMKDTTFLNQLQSGVNKWSKEIQRVAKLQRDPTSGSAMQEINFWLGMEKALTDVQQQLQKPEIQLTMNLLKGARRFMATMSFENDTGLKLAMEKVSNYLNLLRDFPISDLLVATSIEQVTQATRVIFQHMRRIKNASQYPLWRAYNLVEAVSRDLASQLLKILSGQRLMQQDSDMFESNMQACNELFRVWDDEVRQFKELVREQLKKRGNFERPPLKINCEHTHLQERIVDLQKFRKQHMKLQEVIEKVLAEGKESSAKAEVVAAYRLVENVDVLDVSRRGGQEWEATKKRYEERIDHAESEITARLRDRLGAAKTATEMFRVFSRFNALFVRPRIRGAIQEYQTTLIQQVKDDVARLQDKFKETYESTQACKMTQVRDIPPTAGLVIWAKQLERRLQVYMGRVEDVLGRGWEQHVEGQKLKQEGDAFAKKMRTGAIFDQWLKDTKDSKSFDVGMRIFDIQQSYNSYTLIVNYDEQIITLFKEVRNLQALQFRVPYAVKVTSDEAKQNYPFAMTLQEATRTYMQTCAQISGTTAPMMASSQNAVQTMIGEGLPLKWDSERIDLYTRKLSEGVFQFQQKFTDLQSKTEQMDHMVEQLEDIDVCNDAEAPVRLMDLFEKMQKNIDDMNLSGFSNMDTWVEGLNKNIEQRLVRCLNKLISEWLKQFKRWPNNGTSLIMEGAVHEMRIRNNLLTVEPQKEFAMSKWTKHFHDCLGMVCNLPKLQAARYDNLQRKDTSSQDPMKCTWRNLISVVDEKTLQDAYNTIAGMVKSMEVYVASWLQYQALWEISTSNVLSRLADDLGKWHAMLTEIKVLSIRFESSEQERAFGPIVVDYRKVQSKVKAKYDQWHMDLLNEFGEKVRESSSKFFRHVKGGRESMEAVDTSGDPVPMCMAVLKVKSNFDEWSAQFENLQKCTKLLDRQRYTFPDDWLPIEQLEGEWEAFDQILDRRSRVLESEMVKLKSLLTHREKQMDENITMLYAEWSAEKPVTGSLRPGEAMETIGVFDQRLTKLRDEFDQLSIVKKSLHMDIGNTEALAPLQEEMANLKGVWSEIKQVHDQVELLKETPWTAVVPKKIRAALDETLQSLKNLPAKLRSYEAFDFTQEQLQSRIKLNMLVADLKTDALKERHWKQINQVLKLTVGFNELTLGHLWDADLEKNQPAIKDVLGRAQGEMGLEEFMREVRECWIGYEVELVPYRSKCRLIRGWDELFTQLDEHLQSVQSMKMSPFYKSFEEEGALWDKRLNDIRIIFDIWMDVQRRWVYLEGIFCASADIQQLLPTEFARFRTIDTEFVGIMKKVAAKPKILDIVGFEGILKQLERLSDMLTAVQKALGDYLEKQRSQFARFYFVGDEDLLEMIGNSRDVSCVSRHLGKMFAGIASLQTTAENPEVLESMLSREGEVVDFIRHIKIADDPPINAWLAKTEKMMQDSLGEHLNSAMKDMEKIFTEDGKVIEAPVMEWVGKYPCQVLLCAILADWCQKLEVGLEKGGGAELDKIVVRCVAQLTFMADKVIQDITKDARQKLAQMITEVVHQRDVSRTLLHHKIACNRNFEWLQMMRMYFNPKEENMLQKLTICMADATFFYGFEYLGIADKLVQTPLTDRCFLTLTQALHMRLGANPFGPAGTGKTESVKALGCTMGRFVLVFCCDEGFDFQAMGRIFVGLCQVGAWGCFDEFNRLEERILSAVSEQVLTIQTGNKQNKKEIEILGKSVRLNSNVGIFVTMNPGYAGRSNLPDNLKQLFRAMAMTTPDKTLIAQVNLFNQGFRSAERLAGKVVFLFDLCKDQLSSQPHYDFGLRSLKAVLACAGQMKRESVASIGLANLLKMAEEDVAISEQSILLRAIYDTLVPKLVAQDKPLMTSLISGVFPGAEVGGVDNEVLQNEIRRLCRLRHFDCTANFMLKCMELYQIQRITHGVMLVGAVGTGKSTVWRTLLDAMEKIDGVKGDAYVVDPKAVSKEELYGKLDATTLEWTDGVFTDILRRVSNSARGEKDRRQWIMFDGDVDPEWAENLNSVLDDNKLLTLPNGERLAIPPNVRIMFEVDTLKYATLATVSRCGMVWFAEDVIFPEMMCTNELKKIKFGNLESREKMSKQQNFEGEEGSRSKEEKTKAFCADVLWPLFEPGGVALNLLKLAEDMEHIMVFTPIRALTSLFSLVRKGINMVIEYDENHEDFPLSEDIVSSFIQKYLIFSVCWSFAGDSHLVLRMKFCADATALCGSIPMPDGLGGDTTLLDYEVRVEDGKWYHWAERVPTLDIEPDKVGDSSLIISTVDTVRHTATLAAWLEERRPFILSGPPGSGKTMTLMSTMKAMAGQLELASLNFSAGTTPELLLKTFETYCEIVKTPGGLVMRPLQLGRWVVVFCDECNLPEQDKYGTQRVIMFIRQITEMGGFYRPTDKQWVSVERVQFLGACNPPTDTGRHPMSDRFLRHAPVIWVDYPGPDSLKQIYGTFNRGMLKLQNHLPKNMCDAMTNVMVGFWRASAQRFTSDMQPHYLYSPRELTRWKTTLYETMKTWEGMTVENLVRLVIHEALRIFVDRLVFIEEREWSEEQLDDLAMSEFGCSKDVLVRPILFSTYLNPDGHYVGVEREALRLFIQDKLKIFYEEELAVHLVIFDEVLDHIVRMDRVLRQPLGHLLLVGASGAGKTVLSKFVSWMNGLTVYTLKVGRNYDVYAFEVDLRAVMKRSGVKQEKITFIFDESNALGPAFLERMNALLAAGEVPGLFEGDEYTTLMHECRTGGMQGMDDSELFAAFTKRVQRNLHIVFTMNPANPDFSNRSNSSPALFNRCVIDWFGDWPHEALIQVGADFTKDSVLSADSFSTTKDLGSEQERHAALANIIVSFHESVDVANTQLRKMAQKYNYITPRDFLDFLHHFLGLLAEKKAEVEEQQNHIGGGLKKLKETETQVAELQLGLADKEKELVSKNKKAEEKMNQMVKGQTEAEEKKTSSTKLARELQAQTAVIEEKRGKIQKEIDEVEPALAEAKKAVSAVDKRSLDELRMLGTPPNGVVIAMESVVTLVKPEVGAVNWGVVQKVMKDPNFITSILTYNAENLKESTRMRVEKEYLSSKAWDVTAINRASRCAGPVALWVQSQMKFAALLTQLEPMRNELKTLEQQMQSNTTEFENQNQVVKDMEKKIAKYKEEYAHLIAEVSAIKTEMTSVEDKCKRSTKLLGDLSGEKIRWEASSQGFQKQTNSLIGDVLLSGAFCTYIGFFDLFMRGQVIAQWKELLNDAHIKYKEDLSLIDYLSNPSERLAWKENALPDDSLAYENAIILKRFIRYPLIIDPSGQAVTFLTNEFKSKRLMKTSFVAPDFMKQLETSLRFGAPLLVMDVERVDPILNNVLNKETHKQGPRVLISLGDQDIDFSPAFSMYMCTRDSTKQFTPDLCSRVTFVNFTVTPSSLQNQCMNSLLKSERPDIDQKRADLLKLQGEFKVKIRQLEDNLLRALSEVQGSILEDTKVIATLEKIKKESKEIQEQVDQTDSIMREIEQSSQLYETPGQIAASLFFLLESMGTLHTFYRYSLAFFFDIFDTTIKNAPGLATEKEYDARLKLIERALFNNTFQKIAPGLQEADVLVFACRLAQLFASGFPTETLDHASLDLLLKGTSVDIKSSSAADAASLCETLLNGKLNGQQVKGLQELHLLPAFQGLAGNIKSSQSKWEAWLAHFEPENALPDGWSMGAESKGNEVLQEILLMKALRPDRVVFSCVKLVDAVLGIGFVNVPAFNLADVLEKDSKASAPIMMVSVPGNDPSGKVTELAQSSGKSLTSVAMGSEEGFAFADKAIAASSKSGTWVLLKNVHLAIKWLTELEKKLYGMNPHQNFRLFLTMEFNPRIPANLIRLSRVYVFEPPSGVKASLQRSFTQVLSGDKTDRMPVERCRLHFLLAFFHAIVLERLRFYPVGWSKKYEFSDADQVCGRDIIDAWVDSVSQNGKLSNISPDKIPWDAIQTVLTEAIYGGRIDNEFDHAILRAFVHHLFREESFNADFKLNMTLAKEHDLVAPDARKREQFLQWIEDLPAKGDPTWIGLPVHAEQMLRINRANHTMARWLALQASAAPVPKQRKAGQKRRSRDVANPLTELGMKVNGILGMLPETVAIMSRTDSSLQDSLWRCFDREMGHGKSVLGKVRADLRLLASLCEGNAKSTNETRELISDFNTDAVPKQWRKYSVHDTITVTEWLSDFKKRLEQLEDLHNCSNLQKYKLWMGGLFFPEAFLTASRQAIAQKKEVSLEELLLAVYIGSTEQDADSFSVKGLTIEGAAWDAGAGQLTMSDELFISLPMTQLKWLHRDSAEHKATTDYLRTPVYLNTCRNILVTAFNLKQPKELPNSSWVQRSMCLTLWSSA